MSSQFGPIPAISIPGSLVGKIIEQSRTDRTVTAQLTKTRAKGRSCNRSNKDSFLIVEALFDQTGQAQTRRIFRSLVH
ncbi:MAG: hypothetical protein LH647_17335, partial [Leptolyngbyaceae cyanobacterium CAN_BIN12]|nr:hypothetical protein [Leptolyngbyaceae cyanobacterium CAN_BIN12]